MPLKNNSIQEIFSRLSGKYRIKRTIVNSASFAYKEQGAKPMTNRRATSNIVSESKSIDYIDNHGYGEGAAYFLPENLNELLYTEELKLHYHDCNYQIPAVKEYRYILENNNIAKYFAGAENNLFYQLKFVDMDSVYSNDLSIHAVQHILDYFRQDEFKGEPAQRIKIREHRRILQNSLVSSDLEYAVGSHLCGKDQYNATYIFLNPDSFCLNYQILGPKKDYNINTVFNRI